jgi:tetratricopeptide (TPR) repeat protein
MWHALVRTDNLLGPKYALGSVLDNIAAIQAALPLFQDHEALRLVDWASQFAESAAWLHEDLGQLPQAASWIDRAHAWAMQTGNQPMVTWTVVGRARQALERSDPGAALPLAEAAEFASRSISPRMRAAALCYQAEAHALLGDEVACHRALDLAERCADEGGPDEKGDAVAGGHGSFCTTDYVSAQRGRCWLRLGKPDRSLPLYTAGLQTRPTVYQRDRGWGLAGLAATHFALGEAEPAATIASKALQIGINAGSARTVEAALRVVRQLPKSAQIPETNYLLGASEARA